MENACAQEHIDGNTDRVSGRGRSCQVEVCVGGEGRGDGQDHKEARPNAARAVTRKTERSTGCNPQDRTQHGLSGLGAWAMAAPRVEFGLVRCRPRWPETARCRLWPCGAARPYGSVAGQSAPAWSRARARGRPAPTSPWTLPPAASQAPVPAPVARWGGQRALGVNTAKVLSVSIG